MIAEGILIRLILNRNDIAFLSHDVRLFDLKILFLLSALCPDCRPRLRYTLNGIHLLMSWLDITAQKNDSELNQCDVVCCNQVLKVIHNLLLANERPEIDTLPEIHMDLFATTDSMDESQILRQLIKTICCYLAVKVGNNTQQDELRRYKSYPNAIFFNSPI